jgi:hypothetical protein
MNSQLMADYAYPNHTIRAVQFSQREVRPQGAKCIALCIVEKLNHVLVFYLFT